MKSVFLRASIVILGILLCANFVVSFLGFPAPSYAAKNFQYKVIEAGMMNNNQVETALNKLGSDGWEVVAVAGTSIILKK